MSYYDSVDYALASLEEETGGVKMTEEFKEALIGNAKMIINNETSAFYMTNNIVVCRKDYFWELTEKAENSSELLLEKVKFLENKIFKLKALLEE